MTVALSSADQDRIATAARTLASPVAGRSVAAWQTEAIGLVTEAAGIGTALFVAPAESGLRSFSPGLDTSALPDYERHFPYLVETGAFARSVSRRVVTRREAYGPRYDEIVRSEYAQEFLPAVRSFDAITMTAPVTDRPRLHRDVVQLALVSPDPVRPYDDRHKAVARLLYPSFEAGVRIYRSLRAARSRLRAAVDATGAACVVADRDGVVVHRTPAFEALLALEPDREAVCAAAGRLAEAFLGTAQTRSVAAGRRATYRLRATEVRDGGEPYVVVVADPEAPDTLSAASVRDRLGLTSRQAEVAVLLAERRSNREIAAALSVSVHTARHHVEAVLDRLGVRRGSVKDALRNR